MSARGPSPTKRALPAARVRSTADVPVTTCPCPPEPASRAPTLGSRREGCSVFESTYGSIRKFYNDSAKASASCVVTFMPHLRRSRTARPVVLVTTWRRAAGAKALGYFGRVPSVNLDAKEGSGHHGSAQRPGSCKNLDSAAVRQLSYETLLGGTGERFGGASSTLRTRRASTCGTSGF